MLSNEAFTRLNERLISNYTFCRLSGIDDVDVNRCLRLVNVHMGTSVDDFGRQRFLAVNIMKHFYGSVEIMKYIFLYFINNQLLNLKVLRDGYALIRCIS